MADSWGGSWGNSWGVSWGSGAVVPPVVVVQESLIGGKKKKHVKRLFPSDEFPFDDFQLEKPLQAHEGRVFVDELAKLDAQIEFLQTERNELLQKITIAMRSNVLQRVRLETLAKLKAVRSEIDAELGRLKRQKAKQAAALREFTRIIREQDEEDLIIILAIQEFFD